MTKINEMMIIGMSKLASNGYRMTPNGETLDFLMFSVHFGPTNKMNIKQGDLDDAREITAV